MWDRARWKLWVNVVCGCSWLACGGLSAQAQDKPPVTEKNQVKPIRALLITGGCCHDYEKQKKIITEGISSRAFVEWEIVHQGGTATNSKIPYYENADWAKGFDIVVHNECFSDIPDPKWTERVLKPHREGIPAIVIHCAMHCYRDKTEEWFKFLGVTSHQHGAHYPFEVVNVAEKHPIMQGFGNVWLTPKGELYQIAKLWDTATPLAYAMSRETMKKEPCIWINQYGKTRVFGTTIGHYNEEVSDPIFLNLVTQGLLWATDKTQDEYRQPFLKPKKVLVPENLGLKKPATASGSQEGHDPSHGNDGNEDTRWCGADGSPGYTWQVDLGQPEELTGARIYWESDGRHYRYKVEGSPDGKAWSVLSDQSAGRIETQEHLLKFAAQGIRHVRLTFLGADPGAWGSFWEFEVHGKKTVEKIVTSADLLKPRSTGGAGVLRDIKVPSDFEATVFAAPPQVTYPTCLATDVNGRLFVGIDENGSLDRKPGRGRIVRCVDTNQDGQADQFTTFAKLDSPRGLIVDGRTLYVQHPPFVTAYHDENDDGVADKSQVLVKGLGFDLNFRGADHTTNGMTLGIDGWLYIAVGDYGFVKAEGSDGQSVQMRGGGVVRVRPDGSELEIVSRGQRNIYDVAVDPYLNLFTRDNTNDGGGWNVRLSHVVPSGQYGYPSLFINFPEEIVQPLADYGGGSPCGSLFVDDGNLGPDFGHTLYTCDWGRSIVYRHPLTRKGAGFDAQQEPFIEIPRPTDMEIDGRSQMFISSWKDGGFNFSRPDVGYVIRVAPRGGVSPALADFSQTPDELLIRIMQSPSHVQRLHAQRELLRRGQDIENSLALSRIVQSDASLQVRVLALLTNQQMAALKTDQPEKLNVDKELLDATQDPALCEFALRALADRRSASASVPSEPFLAALKSTNPRIRLQGAWGLARLGRAEAAAEIVPLTVDIDPLVAHVAIRSLIDLQAAEACLAGLASPAQATGCLRVLRQLHRPEVVQGLIQRLPAAAPELKHGILTALCRLTLREDKWTGDWWSTRPDTTGPYYNSTAWESTDAIRKVLEEILNGPDQNSVKWLLLELKRHKLDLPGVQAMLLYLVYYGKDFRLPAIQLLAARDDLKFDSQSVLADAVRDEKLSTSLRAQAARCLIRNEKWDKSGPSSISYAVKYLIQTENLPPELQAVEDEYLRDPRHALYVSRYPYKGFLSIPVGHSGRILDFALLLMVSEQSQAPSAARDLANKTIEKAWTTADAPTLLRAIGRTRAESQSLQVRQHLTSKDPAIAAAAKYAAERLELDRPTDPNQPLLATLKYEDVANRLKSAQADPKQGLRLFARQGCVACHTVSPNETLKGPLLAGIAARYKREELIESILKPSQKIAQGFESQFFAMSDGLVHEGFVVREAADELELRSIHGTPLILKKADIEDRGKRAISMMPEKLVDQLTVNQLASLLAYLESLKAN